MHDALPIFPCNDCRVDVLAIDDWYLARPEIWKGLGLGPNYNLCLACLERRLGRPLRSGILDIGPPSTFFLSQPPLSARLKTLLMPRNRKRR